MNLNINATDDQVTKMLDTGSNGGNFVDTKELEWVGSGMYACEISSAIVKTLTNSNTGATNDIIECTCVAYSKAEDVLGKFKVTFSLDETNEKAKTKIFQLLLITDNRNGCEETNMTKKDGTEVIGYDGKPIRQYKALCNKRIYMGIVKTGENMGSNGQIYPKYALYFMYNKNKQSGIEIWKGLPATSVTKDFVYLQKVIKEKEAELAEQAKLVNSVSMTGGLGGGNNFNSTPVNNIPKEPTPPKNELDDLPF